MIPRIDVTLQPAAGPEGLGVALQILLLLTVLSLAPAILVLMTGFTRIVVALSFLRSALGTPQAPPNQVLVGLALFLTVFIMAPVWQEVYQQAWIPYRDGQIGQVEALQRAQQPVREFMFRYTRERDLALFLELSGQGPVASRDQVPTYVLIPAFAISELKTAFQIGFMLYVPFLVIDMVVASTLMSMGMLMVPPMLVSLPFKILLFVLVDGWNLVVRSLLASFGAGG
ncbi:MULTISPECIES: flagellar type III secretion system pore protein FliP [Thermaerobacter]|uniref:Flagellar biosynthetic protein FliP n=1 Tax=Thermaerobacter composti TaxID=554949 RepID=A0ABZ0QR49_9FIRM|nr:MULTISPECIES: flagellar type III secretion system pore protein FliP [Thermaerobacter]PZN04430.1 MAG: flagellar biosynthetic protein FliP [Bacillota bacterium]QBS37821.1 flagellar type III secretion system pore protein FliP [Thermaerobacter sp. FW80]WPD19979.1 flagellar type III secretion system pore protein FliP [Thermaerobacter composti]